ncbi:MAG: hypothetical protein ACOYN0_12180 [Phycisphaerales bacterium]
MEIPPIQSPIPFAAAKAYAASMPRPAPRVDQMVGQPAARTQSPDRVDLRAHDAVRAKVQDLVAAKVNVKPFADSREAATQPRDAASLPMYRHPADKNAAAVRLQGNRLDVEA